MAAIQTDRPAQKQSNTEGRFCTLIADIRNSVTLFEGSQASPACPSDKTSTKTKMSVVHWCNDTDGGKRQRQENTPVTVTLCLPEVPDGLTRGSNPTIRCQILPHRWLSMKREEHCWTLHLLCRANIKVYQAVPARPSRKGGLEAC
jgi:hypothetical protein